MPRVVTPDEWRNALEIHDAARLRHLARQARPVDVAETLGMLDPDDGLTILRALPRNAAALVLSLLPESIRTNLLDGMSFQLLTDLLGHLPPDDAVDLLHELPPEQASDLLKNTLHEQADKLQKLMAYGEETAGGLMTTVLIAVPNTATVAAATEEIRHADLDDDEFFNVYVIDRQGRLDGLVPIAALITRPTHTTVADIMETDLITVRANEDQEAVVNIFRRYDFSAVPVVDDAGRLVGRITADDVMDAADEEAAEDLYRMAGTDPAELESTSPFRAARIRGSWLMPCVAGCLITASIVIALQAHLPPEMLALILAFVPFIGAMGGNTGIQTSTGVVRALAFGQVPESRLRGAIEREIPIAALLALAFGLISALAAALTANYLQYDSFWNFGFAVGLSMWIAVTIATSLGVALPFLFQKLGVDPAIASGPIITTSNDLIAVSIYLIVSLLLL